MKNSLRTPGRGAALSAAVLGASALILSACGAPPAEEAGGSGENSDYLGCIVSDSGGFDDRSFNQSSYEGLKKAEKELGIEINQAESQAETDFGPNVDQMVQQGCDLTVTVGFLLADTTKEAAEANPDSHFAIVDDNSIEADNVKPIIYDTAQAAFLAGYAAAATSETGKVATYGGINIPTVTIFMDGFADGVSYYNEQKDADVQLLGWDKEAQNGTFIGNFNDQGAGKTNTQNFINEGADVIMPVAGPVGLGTLDAVIEANEGGKKATVVWVDSDGYETAGKGEEFILTSVMKLMGDAVNEVISSDVEGDFDNTPYIGTLENGGVALAPFHDQEANVPEELQGELDEIKEQIVSGDIAVESAASPK
ncbi:BMP family ABC transporter substrate-binding protein [Arthrobacter crusticola]|uniref:BMP family ABC transporter substrate-binding protein n=1 Tax=Arthrobacter crusticola TaxID=2547960 RepID=A0A4R5TZR8_9MICC|nr:BMP family ABC transporter substrate-binding protein [Arthrobacter crusticola]TDK26755.1 BMP family ABC transporter substrate-binding protein [Arthrobacter crusticola]